MEAALDGGNPDDRALPFMSLTPFRPRRFSRPSSPSCRGGASSLLRLAQPGQRTTDFGAWIDRAAAAMAPAVTGAEQASPSIITLLTPSHRVAARS